MCKVILVSLLVFEGEVILDGFEGLIPVESVADRFSPVCLSNDYQSRPYARTEGAREPRVPTGIVNSKRGCVARLDPSLGRSGGQVPSIDDTDYIPVRVDDISLVSRRIDCRALGNDPTWMV